MQIHIIIKTIGSYDPFWCKVSRRYYSSWWISNPTPPSLKLWPHKTNRRWLFNRIKRRKHNGWPYLPWIYKSATSIFRVNTRSAKSVTVYCETGELARSRKSLDISEIYAFFKREIFWPPTGIICIYDASAQNAILQTLTIVPRSVRLEVSLFGKRINCYDWFDRF